MMLSMLMALQILKLDNASYADTKYCLKQVIKPQSALLQLFIDC